jgi:uncharacterized protein (TIGR04222 family)
MVLTISLVLGLALAYFGPILLRRLLDRTGRLDTPPMPDAPDPYQIAYLRGGEAEVLRLTLFDLIHRGHLEMHETKRLASSQLRLQRSETAPRDDTLSDIERRLLEFFRISRSPNELNRSDIPDLVRRHCLDQKAALTREHMLIPEAVDQRLSSADFLIAAAGCVLGIALGMVVFDHLGIGVGIAILFLFARKLIKWHMRRSGHMSGLGRKYLASLKEAFADLGPAGAHSAKSPRAFRDDPLLSIGLYGSAVLMGTEFAAFSHMTAFDSGGGFGIDSSFGGDGGGFGGGDGGAGGCGGGCGGGG